VTDELAEVAEAFVVDVAADRRRVAAERAALVAPELELAELHLQRVVREQAPVEHVPAAEQELDRLGRLDDADDARQDAENAGLLAARREVRRRGLGIEAAVAGAPA